MADNAALDWQTETLRVTAFPLSPLNIEDIDWWELVTGEKPESRTIHPRTRQLQESGRINEGPFYLTLNCSRDRIDWLLEAAPPSNHDTESLPTCGLLTETLNPFFSLIEKWLPQAPALKRTAFGAVLLAEVPDVRSGHLALSRYLPAVKLDPESSDFSYSINRPRTIRKPLYLKINRLSRWRVIQLVGYKIDALERQAVTQPLGPSWVACRLELDINTDAGFVDELPQEQLGAILKELISLGCEIAEKGDVP